MAKRMLSLGMLALLLASLVVACRAAPTPTPAATATPGPATPTPVVGPSPTPAATPTPAPRTPTPAPTPGVERVVTFLTVADFTGLTAVLSAPAVLGADDYFKWINEQGGVEGVKIKHFMPDARYDVARAVSAYNRYKTEPKFMHVWLHSTPATKALRPIVEKDKVLTQAVADGENQALLGYIYVAGPSYQDMFGAVMDWALADWKKKGKAGTPTFGYIAWDSPYGREALLGGQEYADKLGIKIVRQEFFPVGTPDHTAYLLRLRDAKVDYIFMGAPDPAGPAVLRDADKLGMLKDFTFMPDIWTLSKPGLKLRPELVEGLTIVGGFIRGEDSEKSFAGELYRKYRGDPVDMSELYIVGVAAAHIPVEALRQALKEVGYDRLTSEDVYRNFLKIKDLDNRGLMNKYNFSATERRGSKFVKFYQAKAGKWVSVSDWIPAPDTVALRKW